MRRRLIRLCLAAGLGILSTALVAIPARSADRLTFFYPPFGQFSITTDDLEVFAKEGTITKDFAFYARFIKPEQLAKLRNLLKRRFDAGPVAVSRFTYSPVGEEFLKELGAIFQTEVNDNGFYALRSALILASASSEGLTLVNVMRHFPLKTIKLDLSMSLASAGGLSELVRDRETIIPAIQAQATAEADANPVDAASLPSLRLPGPFKWRKVIVTIKNPSRQVDAQFGAAIATDVYLPQGSPTPAPLIVISHGLASDRTTFSYLAQYLASYGFAVAALEHPGTSTNYIDRFLAGFSRPPKPTEWVDRPLDVKLLLDNLEQKTQSDPAWRGQVDVRNVGLVGQSWGGYTALTLAGATLNFPLLRQECRSNKRSNPFNLSILLQCGANNLPVKSYNLQDSRIKAVMAMNPIDSTVLGPQGLSQIQVPVMMVAGTNDIFAPPVAEQIRPFTWLTTQNKYLVVMEDGTHFSTLGGDEGALPVPTPLLGPNPKLAHPAVEMLSLAFFKTYLANELQYSPYLSAAYVKTINRSPFSLSLIQSLIPEQLNQGLSQGNSLSSAAPNVSVVGFVPTPPKSLHAYFGRSIVPHPEQFAPASSSPMQAYLQTGIADRSNTLPQPFKKMNPGDAKAAKSGNLLIHTAH